VPPFTVATRWARLSRRVTTATGRATVVGQHFEGLPGCSENHWARLDIALNVAVVGLPITVLCPYRADDRDRARIEATHPRLATAAGLVASGTYRPPTEALVEYPPPPPPELGPPAAELAFTVDELADLRHLVAEVAGRERNGTRPRRGPGSRGERDRVEQPRARPGRGRLRLWTTDEAMIAEIADRGTATLPFPGMIAPPTSGVRGRGLWLASELCDVMQVWSDGEGTVVRLRMDTSVRSLVARTLALVQSVRQPPTVVVRRRGGRRCAGRWCAARRVLVVGLVARRGHERSEHPVVDLGVEDREGEAVVGESVAVAALTRTIRPLRRSRVRS
jgi:hypothetical protein